MHASEVTQETIERANELYWASAKSVNQIADTLELSKGALYGAIEPLPSGRGCPMCGEEVAYPNRTAKERGVLDCPTCEWDGGPDEAIGLDLSTRADGSDEPTDQAMADAGGSGLDVPEATPPRPLGHTRTSTIAGGALLGAAAGLALVMWARRR